MDKQCGHCGAAASRRCARCQKVVYCSQEHQKAAWKTHKPTCVPASSAASSQSPSPRDPVTLHASSATTATAPAATTTTIATTAAATAATGAVPSTKARDKGEDIDAIMEDHEKFERTFNEMRTAHGLSLVSMPAAFDLMNSWIGLYKLEPTEALLAEVMPVCEQPGEEWKEWRMRAVQCRAFLRYKQHRFRDALADFLTFQSLAGDSAELAENMGHTYNTLGDYAKAEERFTASLRLMDLPGAPPKSSSNRGGVLLGLGLVKERLGRPAEGLEILEKALAFYRQRFQGVEHSLVAKTLMSVGHTQEKLQRYTDAVASYREATRIFKVTCGDDTPLTANAIFNLAKALYRQNPTEARELLQQALKLYVGFDTLHVYIPTVIEILNEAKSWSINEKQDPGLAPGPATLAALNRKFVPLVPHVVKCDQRLQEEKEVDKGTLAVFDKVGGEVCMLAGKYDLATPLIKKAIAIFKTVTEVNCDGLIKECEGMLAFTGKS